MAIDSTVYAVYGNTNVSFQYLTSWGQIQFLNDAIMDGTINGYSVSGLFQNSNDYIVSMDFYPLNMNFFTTTTTTTNIKLGKVSTTLTAYDMGTNKSYVEIFSTSITRHFNNFLDFEPFTTITLYVPFFDKFNINPVLLYGKTIKGYMSLDTHSGRATFSIYADDVLIDTRSSQIAINIPWGKSNEQEQQRNNILQLISTIGSVVSTGVGVASGNATAVVGGVALATKTLTTAIQNNVDALTGYTGGSGGRDGLCVDKTIRWIIVRPQNATFPDVSLRGKPIMSNYTLSSLSGYTEIGEIHFNPSNEDIFNDEINEITELLKSGVIL